MAKSKSEVVAEQSRDNRTAAELLAYLRESGTGDSRLKKIEWLAGEEDSLAALYQRLEAEGVPLGTLSRAGKWIWGDGFEPKLHTPADTQGRLEQLARENETLKKRVRELEGDNGAMKRQLTLLTKKNADLMAELGIYNPVRHEEAAGIH